MVRTVVRRTLITAVSGVMLLAVVPSAGAATHPTTASTVSTRTNTKLGPILVAGTTVYTVQPGKTGCNAACMKEWPPVLLPHGVKTATAGPGVDASMLGTAKLAKRGLQITWAGKRLYWSAKDKKAGQVHGDNVTTKWGTWSTVTATVAATTTLPATTAPPPTAAPETAPPATAAPETAPPATAAPETAPPATAPPTSPPPTSPPATTSPGNGGVGF
jgi:predicted lipoprotein with Yx(FWY)xxD motif